MSIASLLSIKVTSPITHMVSSAVRGVAASFLGVWLFQDVITTYVCLSMLGAQTNLFLRSVVVWLPLRLSWQVQSGTHGSSTKSRLHLHLNIPAERRMVLSKWRRWRMDERQGRRRNLSKVCHRFPPMMISYYQKCMIIRLRVEY
jgi:hypothetical protein